MGQAERPAVAEVEAELECVPAAAGLVAPFEGTLQFGYEQ